MNWTRHTHEVVHFRQPCRLHRLSPFLVIVVEDLERRRRREAHRRLAYEEPHPRPRLRLPFGRALAKHRATIACVQRADPTEREREVAWDRLRCHDVRRHVVEHARRAERRGHDVLELLGVARSEVAVREVRAEELRGERARLERRQIRYGCWRPRLRRQGSAERERRGVYVGVV